MTDEATVRPDVGKAVARLAAAWILMPALLLATGGSLWWWEAWIYCALLLVPMTAFVLWAAVRDPEFIERRLRMREKERAQRSIQKWGSAFYVLPLVLPGIDHRLGWSQPPRAAVVAGMALSLAGYLAILRVFLENRWAGRTVETWAEQKVISTGPYAIVRHPMYSGVLVYLLATPLALGSWWGMLSAVGFVPFLVARIRNEEALLVRELPGYDDYRRRVRRRLVPGLW